MTGSDASDEARIGADYHAALAALADRGRFGIRLGLGRTRALLRALGDPQLGIRGALVAGTNGKGSVLALAASAIRAAGLRAGETPKPHLVSYRERLQIAGHPVDAATFTRLVTAAIAAADRLPRRLGDPTEFELLTAVVFSWFAEEDVDLALVEVGLGGRLDATHAWDGGVAAITNVDLDHMDRLGPTIAHIAREKAAIIERGDRAVTGATGEALAIVRRRAARLGAPLTIVEPARILGQDRDGLLVEVGRLGETRVGLRGRHQAANVAVADAVLDALGEAGIAEVGDDARRRGYAEARWPGRLELLTIGGRDVLLDGAHNPAGASALATAVDDLRPFLGDGRVTLVTASMADKDVAGIVAAARRSRFLADARIIATSVGGPRALSPEALAALWAADRRAAGTSAVDTAPDPDTALARALAGPPGPIVVAGSLYLVGAVRARLVDEPLLHDPPSPDPPSPDPGDNPAR
ncbi:MAG TPA: cyanophycin synthetase [Candidatus Limnocylindrales bacterium]|nr:cyanophycin synthetase [Candidatus Limnocylindrales bacterium]